MVADRPTDSTEYEHPSRATSRAVAEDLASRSASRSSTSPAAPVMDRSCSPGRWDGSPASIATRTRVARARARTGGEFIRASVPPLPLDDASFDCVVSFETIEHLADDEGFVHEIVRVLQPGGRLPDLESQPLRRRRRTGLGNEFHVREYSLDEFREVLERAGLEIDLPRGAAAGRRQRPPSALPRAGLPRARARGAQLGAPQAPLRTDPRLGRAGAAGGRASRRSSSSRAGSRAEPGSRLQPSASL